MKYDKMEFFVTLIIMLIGNFITDLISYYMLHVPLFIILEGLNNSIMCCILFSAIINVYVNLRRIYEHLDHDITEKYKEVKLTKIKAEDRIRSILLRNKS